MRDVPVVGVIVLCAKPDELYVIQQHFDKKFTPSRALDQSMVCYDLPPRGDAAPQVMVVAHCVQMGNMYSASSAGFLIATLKPNLVIFVGTAGSLDPAKCGIGDVVVPDLGCTTKYFDKISELGENDPHRLATDLRPVGHDGKKYVLGRRDDQIKLTTASRAFITQMRAAEGPAIEELLEHFVVGEKSTKAKIKFDTKIFSWDMVLDSSHYRDHLRAELDRKVFAVDMESFGFLAAIEQFQEKPYNRTVSGIVVRGISDVCGDKATSDDDGRNALAMRNASVVASELVLRAY